MDDLSLDYLGFLGLLFPLYLPESLCLPGLPVDQDLPGALMVPQVQQVRLVLVHLLIQSVPSDQQLLSHLNKYKSHITFQIMTKG